MTHTVVLIGAGNMGYAMLTGWLRRNPELVVHVVEPYAQLQARAKAAGAGHMALSSATSPTVLREQVTSPNGTTAAAIAVFSADHALVRLVGQAATAARDRGIALGREG